jgi:hypothetical protein
MFLLNPFIIYTANNQNVFALAFPINNSYDRLVAQMNNYDSYSSYFHYVDSFSDLSRDTTSSNSSDLLEEDNTAPTEEIGQDNINTAADSVDEPTADTNQSSSALSSSSSSSSSDLLEEDNTAPTEEIGQDNINTADDSVDEPTADTNQSSSSP